MNSFTQTVVRSLIISYVSCHAKIFNGSERYGWCGSRKVLVLESGESAYWISNQLNKLVTQIGLWKWAKNMICKKSKRATRREQLEFTMMLAFCTHPKECLAVPESIIYILRHTGAILFFSKDALHLAVSWITSNGRIIGRYRIIGRINCHKDVLLESFYRR